MTGQLADHPLLAGADCASTSLASAVRAGAWQLSDGQVQDAISTALRVQAQAAALLGVLVGEAESRTLRLQTQAVSTARWLGDHHHLSGRAAESMAATAGHLERHPRLAGAMAVGEVGVEHATVIGEALDAVAGLPCLEPGEAEDAATFLIDQGKVLSPRELARAGQQLVEALTRTPDVDDPAEASAVAREQQRAEEEAEAAARDRVSWRHRPRLGRRGRGVLDTGPVGDALVKAWEHQAGKPHPGSDGFQDTRTREERLGQALLDLIAAALGQPSPTHGPSGSSGVEDDEPEAAHLCDPLPLGDDSPPSAQPQPRQALGRVSARAVLAITVTLAELQAALASTSTPGATAGMLDTGVPLTPAELRLWACDAGIIPAVLGTASQVLDLGRAARTSSTGQLRALAIRDRGCIAPGCDRPPAACDAHHCRTWADGGPTDLANMALLCSFHHHQVHRQHWQITLATNGWPALTPPTSIDPDQRPRQHHRFRLQLVTGRHRT